MLMVCDSCYVVKIFSDKMVVIFVIIIYILIVFFVYRVIVFFGIVVMMIFYRIFWEDNILYEYFKFYGFKNIRYIMLLMIIYMDVE